MSKIKIAGEFWSFITHRKKYIFIPIILVLALMTIIIFLVEIPVLTPFVYALF